MTRFFRRARIFIVALAVLGVMLEGTARVYLFGLAGLDPRKVDSVRDFRASEFVRISESPEIGLEHVPNVEGFFQLVRYRTNAAGLRDRDYTLAKPANTFRVAVLGSSFTVPAGVRIEDAFHTRMEDRLNRVADGPRYEFINFAIGAIHPRQVASILIQRALAWDPDLVLFGITSMSMQFLEFPLATPDSGHASRRQPRTHPFFGSFLVAFAKQRSGFTDVAMPTFKLRKRPVQTDGSIVDVLGRISRQRELPIVMIRLEFDAERDRAVDLDVIEAIRREGLYFFDTRSRFEGMNARRLWIHPLNPHPNAEAHALFADGIMDYLEDRSLLAKTPR